MVSKTLQVKEAGSRSDPASVHISPQRGLKNISRRSRFLPIGAGLGVTNRRKEYGHRFYAGVATGVAAPNPPDWRSKIMAEENKKKFPLWMYPETQRQVKEWYKKDNCGSQSEFIEKAILFYCGYISAENSMKFLPTAITSAMAGVVENSENRIARLLFKLAVEMSMMMNIIASNAEIDETLLQRLRGKCVTDVKKSVGAVTFEDVVRFQKGD